MSERDIEIQIMQQSRKNDQRPNQANSISVFSISIIQIIQQRSKQKGPGTEYAQVQVTSDDDGKFFLSQNSS